MSENEHEQESYECPECGNTVTVDDDGYATCYGYPGNHHPSFNLVRPCGICGDPIRTCEICQDCADESEGDAFTTNWGLGSDLFR